jgi:hypothetical protein
MKLSSKSLALGAVFAASLLASSAQASSVVISKDLTNPDVIPGLTGFSTTGAMMSGMEVTAVFSNNFSQTLSWKTTGAASGGVTSASGWGLNLDGDTFSASWIFNITNGRAPAPAPAPRRCACPGPPPLGRAGGHHAPARVAAFGAQVDHPVGLGDHVQVVLDHHHAVAAVDQAVQHADQPFHVGHVQAHGGLVQHVQRVRRLLAAARHVVAHLAQLGHQLDALRLAAGQRGLGWPSVR